jgi:hypothetical protein
MGHSQYSSNQIYARSTCHGQHIWGILGRTYSSNLSSSSAFQAITVHQGDRYMSWGWGNHWGSSQHDDPRRISRSLHSPRIPRQSGQTSTESELFLAVVCVKSELLCSIYARPQTSLGPVCAEIHQLGLAQTRTGIWSTWTLFLIRVHKKCAQPRIEPAVVLIICFNKQKITD